MQLICRPERPLPRQVALLPGTFNPLTCAHLALARAALATVDEVALVVPRAFPHKSYEGATLDQRVAMLQRAAAADFAIAVSEHGLIIDMVREAREHYGDAEMFVACGRDAAQRWLDWDYGGRTTVEEMLGEFKLLVAAREGQYTPPPRLADAIRSLPPFHFDECSATAVREAIAAGTDWRSLVPDCIQDLVQEIYSNPR